MIFIEKCQKSICKKIENLKKFCEKEQGIFYVNLFGVGSEVNLNQIHGCLGLFGISFILSLKLSLSGVSVLSSSGLLFGFDLLDSELFGLLLPDSFDNNSLVLELVTLSSEVELSVTNHG